MNKVTMKKFTTEEISDLLNRVCREEISFSEMVEVLNYRMSEEPRFKDGDFVYEDGRIIIFKSYPNNYHCLCLYYPHIGKPFFDSSYGIDFTSKSFRRATEDEKQVLLDVLAKEGKRWNEEKKCVEDIPVRKFKKGDKVRIKDGVSSKTHESVCLLFIKPMNELIGKTMTVSRYAYGSSYVECEGICWRFHEDWLEPYEEPQYKNGDFVVGFGCVFILHTQIDKYSAQYHALYAKTNGNVYYYRTYSQLGGTDKLRLATESEKQELLDELAKKGKIWNAEKLCIENMQVRKFKIGDKVRIKHGVSSRTHGSIRPFFAYSMDKLIGKELTVEYCDSSEYVICDGYSFLKEWLEPYEELKDGDFVTGIGCIFILRKQIDEYSAQYHALLEISYTKTNESLYYYKTYASLFGTYKLRLATEAEKQELLNALAKEGKKWNAEKLCVEDILKRKFKKGDKVRIKKGVSSRTHCTIGLSFMKEMDELIGKTMTVYNYTDWHNYVECEGIEYAFLEEWLEPYEELKKGDLAIFWDEAKKCAIIRIYDQLDESEDYLQNKDNTGMFWENAIKFESREQFERFIKDEL